MPEANSSSPWVMRVLTNDYLIDGYLDPKYETKRLSVYGYSGDSSAPIRLASAKFHPTHNIAAPVSATGKSVAVYFDSLIAVIPADAASTESAIKQNSTFQYPLPAEIRAGAYRITGNVMCSDKQFRGYDEARVLIVRDAQIDHTLPDAKLGKLQAPYALVASRQIQAMLPAA